MSQTPGLPGTSLLGEPAFTKIPRAELLRTLLVRGQDPSKIDQATTSLCGPASLMFLTASYWPSRYLDFVRTLYETGTAQIGGLRITPGKDCKNCDPAGSVAAADWVALAGIRDSENVIWDYDDVDDEVGGITLPSTLAGWLRKVGFQDPRNETNVYFTKGEDNLREAAQLRLQGYEVCLFINADAIKTSPSSGNPGGVLTTADHWVVLTSNITFSGSQVTFSVFTWGERSRHVPQGGGSMPISWWLGGYYGYVACKA